MKLGIIVNSIPSINELLKLPLDVKKAYELSLFIKKIKPETEAFEETKNAKIKEYGEEKDGIFQVTQENMGKFVTEMNGVLEKEIDITPPELSIDDIGDGKISNMISLDWLIK